MRKTFLSLLMLLCTAALHAYDCEVDGIYYDLNSTEMTAEVTNEMGMWGAMSYSDSVVIPATITYDTQTYSVTSVGDWAFDGCVNLTFVEIPNSVTTIGNQAFGDCYNLTSLVVPNSVTTIGEDAFVNVNNVVYDGTATGSPWGAKCVNGYIDGCLVYSDATKTILCGCFTIETGEITIPNSVTTIGDFAFFRCSGLTSIAIPNSVTTIGNFAFNHCTELISIAIPSSVTKIGVQAFADCQSLPIIDNLRYADTYLIEAVDKEQSIYTIKDGTRWIGSAAFYQCSNLTSVTIPNSVMTIGRGAFNNCVGLISISIPNSVTTIEKGAFEGCSGLVSIEIPNSVTAIEDWAFSWCSNLLSVTIPNSVTTIGESAFEGCAGLTSVAIPNSVTTIRMSAFYDCLGLTSVTVYWTDLKGLPKMEADVFTKIANEVGPSAATLHIPSGTKSIYEVANQWKDFGTIIDDATDLTNVLIYGSQGINKFLHNGQLIIRKNGKTYNAVGMEL